MDNIRTVKRDFASLEGNGLGGAGGDTLAAMDAFPVAYFFYVHGAYAYAAAAIGAFFLLHFYADKSKLSKKTIQGTQRAQKAAESPVDKDAGRNHRQQDDELPGEQGTQHGKQVFIGRMAHEPHSPFQRTGRADVFAECRYGIILQAVPQGNDHHKDEQNYIF